MNNTQAFIITSRCERRCLYCINKPMVDLKLAEFKKLLNQAIKTNKKLTKIVITGGNPALNKDFFTMCRYVKSKNLKLKIQGTHSDKKILKKYLGLVDEVSVALDSLDEKINDTLRGAGAFNISMLALDFFSVNNFKIQIHTVVNSLNLTTLPDFLKYLKTINFFNKNSWKLFRYAQFGNNPDYSISDQDWNKIKKLQQKNKIFIVDDVLKY